MARYWRWIETLSTLCFDTVRRRVSETLVCDTPPSKSGMLGFIGEALGRLRGLRSLRPPSLAPGAPLWGTGAERLERYAPGDFCDECNRPLFHPSGPSDRLR